MPAGMIMIIIMMTTAMIKTFTELVSQWIYFFLISGQELKSEGRGLCTEGRGLSAEGRGSEAPRVKETQDPEKTFWNRIII